MARQLPSLLMGLTARQGNERMKKRRRKEDGRERRKKAKRMRVEGGGDGEKTSDEMTLKKLGIKRIIWKLNGKVEGISKLYDEAAEEECKKKGSRTAKRHRTGVAMIADISCSHRCVSSVSKSTSTSSTIVNEQRRQPRHMASLPMGARVNDPVCILRKRIAQRDIERKQRCLLLPINQLNKPMLEGMMTAAEKMRTTEKSGLPIKILDRKGREYNFTLRFVASINTFRIMEADYMKLVDDNGIQTGHFLDLWVYRVAQRGSGDGIGNEASELRMAITHDEKSEEEEEDQECALSDEAGNAGGGASDDLLHEPSDEEMEAAGALVSLSHGDGGDEQEADLH